MVSTEACSFVAVVEEQERKYDWTFSYTGANQDAIEVGGSMGIPAGRSLTYGTGSGNVEAAMPAYSASSAALRHAVAGGVAPLLPASRSSTRLNNTLRPRRS